MSPWFQKDEPSSRLNKVAPIGAPKAAAMPAAAPADTKSRLSLGRERGKQEERQEGGRRERGREGRREEEARREEEKRERERFYPEKSPRAIEGCPSLPHP